MTDTRQRTWRDPGAAVVMVATGLLLFCLSRTAGADQTRDIGVWEGTGEGECFWNDFGVPFLFGPTPSSPVGRSVEASLGPFSCWSHPRPLFSFFGSDTRLRRRVGSGVCMWWNRGIRCRLWPLLRQLLPSRPDASVIPVSHVGDRRVPRGTLEFFFRGRK